MNWITIDAGNTRIKIARWNNQQLIEVVHFHSVEDVALAKYSSVHSQTPSIISSVKSEIETNQLVQLFPTAILFNAHCKIPLKNNYDQPETLGIDRLANAIAGFHRSKRDTLIIDAGTCLKCDFVSKDGAYQGGSISPGLHMRFQALHDYTGKLPLIEEVQEAQLIGKTTVSSCTSGVINGMLFEMEGFIQQYRKTSPELTIFLTGGDAPYFELGLKSAIFANENLTLEGLLLTLQYIHA